MACSSPKAGGVSVYVPQKNDLFSPRLNRVTLSNGFWGKSILGSDQKGIKNLNLSSSPKFAIRAERSILVSRSMRWWEKTLQPNMIEIQSAQEFVDQLANAGERLVIVDFYSPGCGGCKALHPKICQLAEMNPNAIFLKVNYEELKKMCHALHIHVLPFFRFYKGSEGRLCSFSCTNATIKKFKDALGKHGTERASNGPAKGLNESELLTLASIGEITLNSPLSSAPNAEDENSENLVQKTVGVSSDLSIAENGLVGMKEEKDAVLA